MLSCCARIRSTSDDDDDESSANRLRRLKDGVMIATCCVSFVAAFAVAMTTIARSGAKNLAASVSIIASIVVAPPVVVSLCLSRFSKPSPTVGGHAGSNAGGEDEESRIGSDEEALLTFRWGGEFEEFSHGEELGPALAAMRKEPDRGYGGRFGESFCCGVSLRGTVGDVMIKRLELITESGELLSAPPDLAELKQEIVSLGSVRRSNVLPLLGFCLEPSYLYLIAPKLPTLANVLQQQQQQQVTTLNWNSRRRIAALVARGLSRLHHGTNTAAAAAGGARGGSILHGDIRPENIHLEYESCTPYIAGAGLLKLTSMPIFRAANTPWRGSSGYVAPEFAAEDGGNQPLSTKADVYSFGALLFVLLSGRTDVVAEVNVESELKRKLGQLMDPKLGGVQSKVQAQRIQQTALKCIHRDPTQRPDMLQVEAMLRPLLHSNNS